ncbi:hypothetical protein S40293_11470, partial [Stachybotrys chartarum IBT 40293]
MYSLLSAFLLIVAAAATPLQGSDLMPHEASEIVSLKNAKNECSSRQHAVYCHHDKGQCARMNGHSEYCMKPTLYNDRANVVETNHHSRVNYHHDDEMFCCENAWKNANQGKDNIHKNCNSIGDICKIAGICTNQPPECVFDTDCDMNEVCIVGLCATEWSQCVLDDDCDDEKICVAGKCTDKQPNCSIDMDCEGVEVCLAGICVDLSTDP